MKNPREVMGRVPLEPALEHVLVGTVLQPLGKCGIKLAFATSAGVGKWSQNPSSTKSVWESPASITMAAPNRPLGKGTPIKSPGINKSAKSPTQLWDLPLALLQRANGQRIEPPTKEVGSNPQLGGRGSQCLPFLRGGQDSFHETDSQLQRRDHKHNQSLQPESVYEREGLLRRFFASRDPPNRVDDNGQ